ncbi:phosphoribosylamine--glycine ligase, partial [Fibrobacterota bacterium]
GNEVVIEEFMEGEEASVIVVTDGNSYVMLPSSQDHKRVNDNDEGLNTGGMGAYAPAPVVTDELLSRVETDIIIPTLNGMAREGCPYRGFLYAGLMVSAGRPKVVEFNCRLGDPETQVILPVYPGDFLELIEAAMESRLSGFETEEPRDNAAIVILAAAGYPGSYEKGKEIMGLDSPDLPDSVHVIHAGTKRENEKLITAGGRVLGLVGQGEDLQAAIDMAYRAAEIVHFESAHYRRDIGKKGLAKLERV